MSQTGRNIAIICLSDDPFEPVGEGGQGGSHRVMFDLGRHFVRRGANVHFLTRRTSPEKPAKAQLGSRCTIHHIVGGPAVPIAYYQLHQYIDQMEQQARAIAEIAPGRIDKVVSYNWPSGELADRLFGASGQHHVHVVLSLGRARLAQGEASSKVHLHWLNAEDRIFARADRIVACAKHEAEDVIRLYKDINPEKVSYIPLGVDLEIFNPKPDSPNISFRREARRFSQGAGDIY